MSAQLGATTYSSVTWTAGDVITEAKLDAMVANDQAYDSHAAQGLLLNNAKGYSGKNAAGTNLNVAYIDASNILHLGDSGLVGVQNDSPYADTNFLYRQAIINGNFDVWQRGIDSGTLTTGVKRYLADRWIYFPDNVPISFSLTRQDGTGVYGSRYCARLQRTASTTGTQPLRMCQDLETANSIPFRSKKLTLSFWARKGANFSAADDYLVSDIVTGTGTDGNSFDGYTGQATLKTQNNVLTTSWQKFTMTTDSVVGDSINQIGIRLSFTTTGTAGAADYFEVTQVQLCAGDVALPFMPKSYQQEYLDCCRFYYRMTSEDDAYSTFGNGLVVDTTHAMFTHKFPTTMRVEPVGEYSAQNDFICVEAATSAVTTAIADNRMTKYMARIYATVASGLTANRPCELQSDNKTTAYIGWSAEL